MLRDASPLRDANRYVFAALRFAENLLLNAARGVHQAMDSIATWCRVTAVP